jgi:hypothetical protein
MRTLVAFIVKRYIIKLLEPKSLLLNVKEHELFNFSNRLNLFTTTGGSQKREHDGQYGGLEEDQPENQQSRNIQTFPRWWPSLGTSVAIYLNFAFLNFNNVIQVEAHHIHMLQKLDFPKLLPANNESFQCLRPRTSELAAHLVRSHIDRGRREEEKYLLRSSSASSSVWCRLKGAKRATVFEPLDHEGLDQRSGLRYAISSVV